MGVTLTPGQRAFARVAYDRESIGDDPLAVKLFGGSFDIPDMARRVIGAVFGARGGKSYALVSLRLIHGAFTRDLSPLAPGEVAYSVVVAPTLKHAKQVINYIRGALESKPELAALMVDTGGDKLSIPIKLPGGKLVTFEAFAAGSKGSGMRGRSFVDAVLDECAFFFDAEDGYSINDVDTFTAAIARVMPGGQVILPSTPWTQEGLLWDVYEKNYGHPITALVAHGTTLDLHDSPYTRELVALEEARDPDNARREYHAEFMTAGAGSYFDGNAVQQACKPYETPLPFVGRLRYAAAADFAFKSDSSALVIVQWDGSKYRVADLVELRPEADSPLLPSFVFSTFGAIAKRYGITHIISDGHYIEAAREHLKAFDIALEDAPSGANGKIDSHSRAKAVLHEGLCELPEGSELPRQLKQVMKRNLPGGGISIYTKRKPGRGHGDSASAWVLAVNRLACAQVGPVEEIAPAYGTKAYDAWLFEKSRGEMMAKIQKAYGTSQEDNWDW